MATPLAWTSVDRGVEAELREIMKTEGLVGVVHPRLVRPCDRHRTFASGRAHGLVLGDILPSVIKVNNRPQVKVDVVRAGLHKSSATSSTRCRPEIRYARRT